MIINIRGTSGSGKTYAIRALMKSLEQYGTQSVIYRDNGKIMAHCCFYKAQPVYILGDYQSGDCGGCDRFKEDMQNYICSLVRHFSMFGHVVFEGLIISHIYSRYVALDAEMREAGDKCVWLFMDTPLDVCKSNVANRRAAHRTKRALDITNTEHKFADTNRCYEKMLKAGMDARILHYGDNMASQLLRVLDEDYIPLSASYRKDSFR